MNFRIIDNTIFIVVFLVSLIIPVVRFAMGDIGKDSIEGKVVLSYGRDNLVILDLLTLQQENLDLSYGNKRIYFPSYPSWSLDGKKILLAHYSKNKGVISVINRSSNSINTLIDSTLDCDYPSWSPDNEQVVFLGRKSTSSSEYHLYLYTFETNNFDILFNNSVGPYRPTWAPDNSRIAFTTLDNQILIYDFVKKKTYPLVEYGVTPCWSPDGKFLVYRGQKHVFLYDFDKKESQKIIRNWGWTDVRNFSWSPDGAYFLFQALTDRKSPLEVYSIAEEKRIKLPEFGNLKGFDWKKSP